MFDVNKIKLGDYVETRDGEFGYVAYVDEDRVGIHHTNTNMVDCAYNEYFVFKIHNNLMNSFKQISTYKFDDEEKKEKINKLLNIKYDYDRQNDGDTRQNLRQYMWNCVNKINEIIDYLNKE